MHWNFHCNTFSHDLAKDFCLKTGDYQMLQIRLQWSKLTSTDVLMLFPGKTKTEEETPFCLGENVARQPMIKPPVRYKIIINYTVPIYDIFKLSLVKIFQNKTPLFNDQSIVYHLPFTNVTFTPMDIIEFNKRLAPTRDKQVFNKMIIMFHRPKVHEEATLESVSNKHVRDPY